MMRYNRENTNTNTPIMRKHVCFPRACVVVASIGKLKNRVPNNAVFCSNAYISF